MKFETLHRIALGSVLLVLAASQAISENFADIHPCDTYAAHPNDPNRWAAGVEDDEIIPGPAVKFCLDAVEEHPDTLRFQFQLGRALWAANRLEEGTATFLQLEEENQYEPVYAYLGDAFYFGIGGVEVDEELAKSLYQIAAETGFEPAVKALEVLTGTAPTTVAASEAAPQTSPSAPEFIEAPTVQTSELAQPSQAPFDPSIYAQPKVIAALYSGDLAALRNSGLGQSNIMGMKASMLDVYLNQLNGQFAGNYNFKDPSCIQIYNPRVDKKIARDMMTTNFGNGSTEATGMAALGMITGMMQQMEQGGVMGLMDKSQNLEVLKEEGQQDGARLILAYGCQSDIVRRIYSNLQAHVLGGTAILSPDQQQRQQKEEAQKVAAAQRKREEEAKKAELSRQAKLRSTAQQGCERKFRKTAFCGCLIDALDAASITDASWTDLGKDFGAIIGIGKDRSEIADAIKTCRQTTSAAKDN